MSACVHIYEYIHRQMFVRPETIDRLTSGPQIKHSFLCVMFASQTVWPYSFSLLFLSQYAFRQRIVPSVNIFTSELLNYFAINLFLQTWPHDATREAPSEFTSEWFIESSLEILENTLRDNNLYRTSLRIIRNEIYVSS